MIHSVIDFTTHSALPAQPAPAAPPPPPAAPDALANCSWKSAAGAAFGFSAGGILGGACGALAVPTAGLGLMSAGEALAMFGPALGFVSILADGQEKNIPLCVSVPAACFIGATMIPLGGLLWIGGLTYLASAPVLAPVAAVVGGAGCAVACAAAGAHAGTRLD